MIQRNLCDASGRIQGFTREDSKGGIQTFTPNGTMVGYISSNCDNTCDARGKVLSHERREDLISPATRKPPR